MAEQHLDLMTLLGREFRRDKLADNEDGTKPFGPLAPLSAELEEFLLFGQNWLTKHPPVQMQYLDKGIGLKLANSMLVTMYPGQEDASMPPDTSVSISQYGLRRDMKRDTSTPIFGAK